MWGPRRQNVWMNKLLPQTNKRLCALELQKVEHAETHPNSSNNVQTCALNEVKCRFAFCKVELMAAASGRRSVSSLQKHTWISWLVQTQQSSKRLQPSREQRENQHYPTLTLENITLEREPLQNFSTPKMMPCQDHG